MNVDSLPVPKLYNAVEPHHWRTICRVAGIALTVQFFLKWAPGGWFVVDFTSIWSLLGGAGLTVLGFVPIAALTRGVTIAIMGGVGLMGIISVLIAGALPMPSMTAFATIGIVTLVLGLWMWSRDGHSALAFALVLGGLGSAVLSLLIPVMGQVPLIFMFKVFGFPAINIIARIFLFLLTAAYIALAVFTVLFVVLKKDQADKSWVSLLGVAFFLFIPFQYLVFGLVGGGGPALLALHVIPMSLAYIFLTAYAGLQMIGAAQRGGIGTFFA